MSFNHVIKLLVNLLVFFFSARREDESRLELRALAAFVLLLAQCLVGPAIRKGGTEGFTDEGRDERRQTDDEGGGQKAEWGGGRRGKRGQRKVQGSLRGTYTQSLSADHQINVLVYFPVLVLRLGAVADRVVRVGIGAVAAV